MNDNNSQEKVYQTREGFERELSSSIGMMGTPTSGAGNNNNFNNKSEGSLQNSGAVVGPGASGTSTSTSLRPPPTFHHVVKPSGGIGQSVNRQKQYQQNQQHYQAFQNISPTRVSLPPPPIFDKTKKHSTTSIAATSSSVGKTTSGSSSGATLPPPPLLSSSFTTKKSSSDGSHRPNTTVTATTRNDSISSSNKATSTMDSGTTTTNDNHHPLLQPSPTKVHVPTRVEELPITGMVDQKPSAAETFFSKPPPQPPSSEGASSYASSNSVELHETTPPSIMNEMTADTTDDLSTSGKSSSTGAAEEVAIIAGGGGATNAVLSATISSSVGVGGEGSAKMGVASATTPAAAAVVRPPQQSSSSSSVSTKQQLLVNLSSHHALLAQRHSSLPLLVVATSSATQQFAIQNQFYGGLSELFQSVADTLISSVVLQQLSSSHSSGSSSSTTSLSLSSLTKLIDSSEIVSPIPFRSINRTIQLEVNADRFYTSDGTTNILQMANLMSLSGGGGGGGGNVNSSGTSASYDQRASVSLRFIDRDRMDRTISSSSATSSSSSSSSIYPTKDSEKDREQHAEAALVSAAATTAKDCIFDPPSIQKHKQQQQQFTRQNTRTSSSTPHGDMSLFEMTQLIERLHVNMLQRQTRSKLVKAGLSTNKRPNGQMVGDVRTWDDQEEEEEDEDYNNKDDSGGDDDDDDLFRLAAAIGMDGSIFMEETDGDGTSKNQTKMKFKGRTKKEQELMRHLFLQTITGHPLLPFMKHIRHELDHYTDFCVQEMIHCPLLQIMVASTVHHDEFDTSSGNTTTSYDYIQVLQELSSSIHHLPKGYQNGQFDPSDVSFGHGGAKRYMVLLHDATLYEKHRSTNGALEPFNEQVALQKMQRAFPTYECVVLCLNNNNKQLSNPSVMNKSPSSKLSMDDMRTLRTFVISLLRDGCIPTMERRVFYLNAVVTNGKKGVKNVFKSFWRKPKTASSNQNPVDALGGMLANSLHGGSNHGGGSAGLHNLSGHNNGGTNSGQWDHLSSMSSHHAHAGGDIPYKFDSIESQTRLLADSLFLMKDYESALSNYRLVKDDFKADKAMVYYASVQEMIALCLYMMDSSSQSSSSNNSHNYNHYNSTKSKYRREAYHAMENALYSYHRAAEEERVLQSRSSAADGSSPNTNYPSRPQTAVMSTRLATRLCLVMSAASPIPVPSLDSSIFSSSSSSFALTVLPSAQSSASARLLDIADLLASASSHETPLGAAVLLEQASRHYLHAMHYRKYSFHMLMSGHMYRSCRQERHAARCFSAALYMYQQSSWKELLDHLQSALAQQLFTCEYYSLSLLLYMQLMDSQSVGKISSKGLQKFWNHVMEICKSHPNEALRGATLSSCSNVLETNGTTATTNSTSTISNNARMIELCNLDLPRVDDDSICVRDMTSMIQLSSSSGTSSTDTTTITTVDSQHVMIWSDMTDLMEAEVRAFKQQQATTSTTSTTTTTDDVLKQYTLVESEKAYAKRLLKKDPQGTPTTTRPCGEPFFVEVDITNPLNVNLDLRHIQVVAEVVRPTGGKGDDNIICGSSSHNDGDRHATTTATDTAVVSRTFHCCPDRIFSQPDSYFTTTNDNDSTNDNNSNNNNSKYMFLVEKQTCLMTPNTTKRLSLGICPFTSEGTILNIVGFRCQIMFSDGTTIPPNGRATITINGVWMYHPFLLKGRLLQDTRAHRANRTYGKNLLLSSQMVSSSPLLQVETTFDNEEHHHHGHNDDNNNNVRSMIHGEIVRGRITIRNIGTASTSKDSIYLKTNVPWFRFVTTSSSATTTTESTSCALGPSGTVMHLPPSNDSSSLAPGHSVTFPFELMARGVGKQELYLLLSYMVQPPNGTSSSNTLPPPAPSSMNLTTSSTTQTRYCQHKLTIAVSPSMTVRANLLPSFGSTSSNGTTTSILSLELTNYRSDSTYTDNTNEEELLDIQLINTMFVCRHYSIVPFDQQVVELVKTEEDDDDHGIKIGWQERLTLHYRIVPSNTLQPTPPQQEMISGFQFRRDGTHEPYKKHQEEPSNDDNSSSSSIDFACLEHAHNQFTSDVRMFKAEQARLEALAQNEQGSGGGGPRSIAQIRRDNNQSSNNNGVEEDDNDAESKYAATSVEALCGGSSSSSETLNVICQWKSSPYNHCMRGQHHLLSLPVRPPTNVSREITSRCPLRITAKHPHHVTHDFHTFGPLTLPIEITVTNQLSSSLNNNNNGGSTTTTIEFEFDLLTSSSQQFNFNGVTNFHSTLDGGDDITTPFAVKISNPGVFNLQCVQLSIYEASASSETGGERVQRKIPYRFPIQWLCHVCHK